MQTARMTQILKKRYCLSLVSSVLDKIEIQKLSGQRGISLKNDLGRIKIICANLGNLYRNQ